MAHLRHSQRRLRGAQWRFCETVREERPLSYGVNGDTNKTNPRVEQRQHQRNPSPLT